MCLLCAFFIRCVVCCMYILCGCVLCVLYTCVFLVHYMYCVLYVYVHCVCFPHTHRLQKWIGRIAFESKISACTLVQYIFYLHILYTKIYHVYKLPKRKLILSYSSFLSSVSLIIFLSSFFKICMQGWGVAVA